MLHPLSSLLSYLASLLLITFGLGLGLENIVS